MYYKNRRLGQYRILHPRIGDYNKVEQKKLENPTEQSIPSPMLENPTEFMQCSSGTTETFDIPHRKNKNRIFIE